MNEDTHTPPTNAEEISAILGSIREMVEEETRLQLTEAMMVGEGDQMPDMLVLGSEMLVAPDAPEPVALQMSKQELKDLIREVLKAELKGDMGEKLSKNIRKTIRREIGKAMLERGLG